MGKIKSLTAAFFAAVLLITVLYLGVRAYYANRQSYSWNEMDWDGDGSTSLSEFLRSSDIGKRKVVQNGVECVEYYAFKDGLAVKTVCPKPASPQAK